jgi:hypothetical protein
MSYIQITMRRASAITCNSQVTLDSIIEGDLKRIIMYILIDNKGSRLVLDQLGKDIEKGIRNV